MEGEELGIEENLARLQNHFGGPNIEVTASWPRGNRDGILNMNSLRETIRWATGNQGHVESFRVKISEEVDPIDIFSEQLKAVEVLDLDNENVEANYATRRDFLARSFRDHLPLLRRLYGA